jgi:hypothetical protein
LTASASAVRPRRRLHSRGASRNQLGYDLAGLARWPRERRAVARDAEICVATVGRQW